MFRAAAGTRLVSVRVAQRLLGKFTARLSVLRVCVRFLGSVRGRVEGPALQQRTVLEDGTPQECLFEFTNVAGPGMLPQTSLECCGNPGDLAVQLCAQPREDRVDQQGDVSRSAAERRQVELNRTDAVEQVGPKVSLRNHRVE